RRHGLRGASAEAALGFPVLFEQVLPALPQGRLAVLFHAIAALDDCNLAHRGGLEGLRDAQAMARGWLADRTVAHARAIGLAFERRRLSPGGAADMLAAACWYERLTTCPPPSP
uniref:triphosphoribosyl-dephospho-CoA synthase n=1 Tax=Pelomonas sp. KK5 TaxID=1855730 RepID=UPI0018E964DB